MLVVVLATAVLFIQRMRSRAVIALVTCTTENVSGLDVSSPVRYRGVPVGRVTDLSVDPRENTVEIDFEVFLDRLNTIGFNISRIRKLAEIGGELPRLRAQIIGNPGNRRCILITGCAKESSTRDGSWVQTDSPLRTFNTFDPRNGTGSAACRFGSRGSDAANPQRDCRQDSRQS